MTLRKGLVALGLGLVKHGGHMARVPTLGRLTAEGTIAVGAFAARKFLHVHSPILTDVEVVMGSVALFELGEQGMAALTGTHTAGVGADPYEVQGDDD